MKKMLSMILFVLILGSVLTTVLVAVDRITEKPIARNKALKLQKGILSSLGIKFDEKDKNDIAEKFSGDIEVIEAPGEKPKKFYRSKTSGDIAFKIEGKGVQGPIEATIALSPNLEQVCGLSIVDQDETPGLGGRIAETGFLDRFKGKMITNGLAILSPGKAAADNEVDGITGATLTCDALEELLNSEIKKYVVMFRESK
jgi:Na+-transporting NADH:ubiquinone oxidoreductase subunit C